MPSLLRGHVSAMALVHRLSASVVVKGAAQLLSGRALAMVLTILATPIIARLFAPQDYGVAALFLAIVAVIGGVLPAGYHRAILFPSEDDTAANLFVLALVTSIVLAVLMYAGLALAVSIWPSIYQASGMGGVLWLVPIAAAMLASRESLNALLIRHGAFSTMAYADVGQSVTVVSTRIGWGLSVGSSALGLVLGQLAGLFVALSLMLKHSSGRLARCLPHLHWHGLVKLAHQYGDYPVFRVPAQLAFILSNHLPVLALGVIYPSATVGYFAMAHRVAALPMQAASQSLSDALLKRCLGQRNANQRIGPTVRKAALALAVLGAPVFSLLFVFGEWGLTLVLGERWAEAGKMLQVLSVYLFFFWMASPFYPVLEALRRNRLQLLLYWIYATALALLFLFCNTLGLDIYETLWLFVALSCVHQLLVVVSASLAMGKHDRDSVGLGRSV